MATAVSLNEVAGPTLKQRLARAERMNRLKSQALILPLLVFLLLTFLVPIAALLYKSVNNPEVVGSLPLTVNAISEWDGKSLPSDAVYKALSEDLVAARKNQTIGDLSKRLNMELAGYRSLLAKTGRALPFKQEPASFKDALESLDERWGDPAYWQVIRRNDSGVTSYFLLASLDHRIDDLGELASATPDQAIYLDIFARTFRPPPALAPAVLAWNAGTVTKLAQAIYDEAAFDRMPFLADALEEAGCADGDLLAHLRGAGPHVRGCWAIDFLLGKS